MVVEPCTTKNWQKGSIVLKELRFSVYKEDEEKDNKEVKLVKIYSYLIFISCK